MGSSVSSITGYGTNVENPINSSNSNHNNSNNDESNPTESSSENENTGSHATSRGNDADNLNEGDELVYRLMNRKRAAENIDCPSPSKEGDVYWCGTPKKKLKTTAKYIFETLFVEGKDSDIEIRALGHEWKLHKLYLQQAGYFGSMFSGRWDQKSGSAIDLIVVDENINVEALNSIFGSFYSDDYEIPTNNILGLVAAASFLQVDGLLDRCAKSMAENICEETAAEFCKTAECYNHPIMKKVCEAWISQSLCAGLSESVISALPLELITRQISSPQLVVVHVELDVYVMCRKYLYLQLFPEEKNANNLATISASYFRGLSESDDNRAFLEKDEGKKYLQLFEGVRYANIFNDLRNIEVIEKDNIVPKSILYSNFQKCWKALLVSGYDKTAIDEFEKYSTRWGRIIEENRTLTWRWMGFTFGFDLLVSYYRSSRQITIKRNTSQLRQSSYHNANSMVCMHPERTIFAKLIVSNKEDNCQQTFRQKTDVVKLTFSANEEHTVMHLDKDIKFPVYISLHVLFTQIKP